MNLMRIPTVLKLLLLIIVALTTAVACTNTGPSEPIYEEVSPGTLTTGENLSSPTGPVILTIGGDIRHGNTEENTAVFDLAMLESMRQVQYEVTDPFIDEKRLFRGVLLSDLLALVGANDNATTLELVALNDYIANMTYSDTQNYPMLLGLQADGVPIPLDEGGPAIIIIPFDDYPNLDHITYDAQWVWSMTAINVR